MNNDIQSIIGTAFFESYGSYCQELVNAGYELESYYNAGDRWGDFSRVLVKVAQLRGVLSYDDYLKWFFDDIKQPKEQLASKQLFARITGIYTPRVNTTQTDRTREYRRRTMQELKDLRESTALAWIDEHLEEAQIYIAKKLTDTK